MTHEEIKQRIAYLVEHGGLWDDPIEDIRRQLRWVAIALAVAVAINAAVLLRLI